MSNKLRIIKVEDNGAVELAVQRCNPGRPWDTVETFKGTDSATVYNELIQKYPKAKYR